VKGSALDSNTSGEPAPLSRLMMSSFVAGLMLLPFSTPAGAGSFVVSFGLPFLAVTATLYGGARILDLRVPARNILPAVTALLLVAALVIGTINSPARLQSAARLVPNTLGGVLFLYVLSGFFRERVPGRDAYTRLVDLYIASAAIVAFYFILVFIRGVAQVGLAGVFVDRVVGGVISLPWGATNVIASTLLLPAMLTYGRRGWWPMLSRALMIACIVLTLSRGAGGALLAGMFILLLIHAQTRRQVLRDLLIGFVLALGVDLWSGGLISEQVLQAIVDRLESPDVRTFGLRASYWAYFLGILRENLLFGVGYYASIPVYGEGGHSLLLTTLVERGIIGAALSSVILLVAGHVAVRNWLRADTPDARLATAVFIAGSAASLLHLLIEDANVTQQYMIYSWIALALPFLFMHQFRPAPAPAPRPPAGAFVAAQR